MDTIGKQMINLDSVVRHIKKKSGYDNEYRIKLYLKDCLNSDEIRDMIAEYVTEDMTNNLEFQDESPQEKLERLERVERG